MYPATNSTQRDLDWSLDALSNWSGGDSTDGSFIRGVDSDADGVIEPAGPDEIVAYHHDTTNSNEIAQFFTDGTPTAFVHDAAGNLVFDGQYVYTYDAWNRLIEVYGVGTLDENDFTDGRLNADPSPHAIGSLVATFGYGPLGRLITYDDTSTVEHYYYDGVRRVQTIDDAGTPGSDPINGADDVTDHEYVYGPDYVDEFVLETYPDIGGNQVPVYVLQDANYNVVALLDASGNVLEQYTWEPYGQVVIRDVLAASALDTRIGHQGLFFYRFDNTSPNAALDPDAVGLYHNRNRWYSPMLGRFTTKDPNESAMLIVSALLMNADSASILFGAFNPTSHFMDGMNLYLYAGSNPITGRDPLGLYDPFEEVDAWVDDRVGNALYTLGALNEGATLGLNLSLEIASILLNFDVLESVVVLAQGQGGFWDAMNIVVSLNPIGKLGKVGGRIAKAFRWMDKAGDTGRVAGRAAEHLFKILPHKQAKKLTKGFGGEIQAHHILEVRHARRMGLNTDDIPSVILPRQMHTDITTALQHRLRCLGDGHPYSKAEIRAAYGEVYAQFGGSDWLQHIEQYLR